jgi:hypothetical protein
MGARSADHPSRPGTANLAAPWAGLLFHISQRTRFHIGAVRSRLPRSPRTFEAGARGIKLYQQKFGIGSADRNTYGQRYLLKI